MTASLFFFISDRFTSRRAEGGELLAARRGGGERDPILPLTEGQRRPTAAVAAAADGGTVYLYFRYFDPISLARRAPTGPRRPLGPRGKEVSRAHTELA